MKNCPKCNVLHDKTGIFCSRKCANSRNWSDEDKIKKSNANTGKEPWNKGKTNVYTEERINQLKNKRGSRLSNELIFTENSKKTRYVAKKVILERNLLKYECSICGLLPIWNNSKLVLQLDHINGINDDHRLENLRFLCPNCHTQQDTYAAKNRFNEKRKSKKYV